MQIVAYFLLSVPIVLQRFVLGVYNAVQNVVHELTKELTAQLIRRRRFQYSLVQVVNFQYSQCCFLIQVVFYTFESFF